MLTITFPPLFSAFRRPLLADMGKAGVGGGVYDLINLIASPCCLLEVGGGGGGGGGGVLVLSDCQSHRSLDSDKNPSGQDR